MSEARKVYDVWLDEETRWTYGSVSYGHHGIRCRYPQGFVLDGESIWYPFTAIQSVVTRNVPVPAKKVLV